jgi:hypothetical protein
MSAKITLASDTKEDYSPPKYFKNEYNGFGRLFKLGGDELRNRVIGEASTNSLVVALFLTISIPAFCGGAPGGSTDSETATFVMLWGLSIFCQMLSLVLSVQIITIMNKCGSERAVIEIAKRIQKDGLCIGGTAWGVALVQWIMTGIAVVYTAFLQYTSKSATAALVILCFMFIGVIVVQFAGFCVGLHEEYDNPSDFGETTAEMAEIYPPRTGISEVQI